MQGLFCRRQFRADEFVGFLVLVGLFVIQGGCQPAATDASLASTSVPQPSKTASPDSPSRKKAEAAKVKIVGDRLGSVSSEPIILSKQPETSPFRFAEIAKESGIDFVHFSILPCA